MACSLEGVKGQPKGKTIESFGTKLNHVADRLGHAKVDNAHGLRKTQNYLWIFPKYVCWIMTSNL
jgi:hypothetical protein